MIKYKVFCLLIKYESGFLYIDFLTSKQVVIAPSDSASLIISSRIFVPNKLIIDKRKFLVT